MDKASPPSNKKNFVGWLQSCSALFFGFWRWDR